jgi:subtilisin family serine protease
MKSWFDAFPFNEKDNALNIHKKRVKNLEVQIEDSISKSSPIQVYVSYNQNDAKSIKKLENSLKKIGQIEEQLKYVPCFIVTLDGNDAKNIKNMVIGKSLESLQKKYDKINLMITDIESGFYFSKQDILNPKKVPYKKSQSKWNLEMIGADIAKEYSEGKEIKIGIIDTGIDFSHSEFQGRVEPTSGMNFVADEPPIDREGHGTHVAGICAGETVGVASQAQIYPLKVLGDDGFGSEANVIKAIEWAIDHNLDIVNMSLGSNGATSVFQNICDIAYSKGLILVAAAGNEGLGNSYPAAFGPSVISVAALERDESHASFSNICDTLDISAPGVEIISSYLGGGYCSMSGTSMATPHVSGCAALYKAYSNSIDFEEIMTETAKELKTNISYPNSEIFGAGLIRIDAMLKYIEDRVLLGNDRNSHKNQNPKSKKGDFIDLDDIIFKSLFPKNNFHCTEDILEYFSKKYDAIEDKLDELVARKKLIASKINFLK